MRICQKESVTSIRSIALNEGTFQKLHKMKLLLCTSYTHLSKAPINLIDLLLPQTVVRIILGD